MSADESLIVHSLNHYFPELGRHPDSKSLFASQTYQAIKTEIDRVVNAIEYGNHAPKLPLEKKPFYRVIAWNLERGIHAEHQLRTMRMHPVMAKADVFLLPETDIGMARSGNVNVARDMARELGFNYFFATSYLNLCKGNSVEGHYEGENREALHGNAILSRYPLKNLRIVPLKNCKDKMRGSEKRLGCQKALVVDVEFPYRTVTMVTVHLDAHSSQRQRASQMETTLSALDDHPHPVLLGGDLNTSTYNARHAFFAFCGFWNKVFRGVGHAIADHYPYPDRKYDKPLFDVFRKHGMEYDRYNELGVGTLHYRVEDLKTNRMMQEVVPEWCRRIAEATLRRYGGKMSMKLDWFAARGLKPGSVDRGALRPQVIPDLKFGNTPLSDHDAIVVDVDIY
jgi:endonuclease/exonuclease/phosphatase family metal-dependent hydrolase